MTKMFRQNPTIYDFSKKSPTPAPEYSGYIDEHTYHHATLVYFAAPDWIFPVGHFFVLFSNFFKKHTRIFGVSKSRGVEGLRKGKSSPVFAVAKGGDYHE